MSHEKESATEFSRWSTWRLDVSRQKLTTIPLCQIVALVLGAASFFSCGGTQSSGLPKDAIVEAENFFEKKVAEDPEQLLGMSEVHVFGRGKYLVFTFVGEPVAQQITSTPEVAEVTIPFWYSGKDSAGRFQKLSRELRVRVSKDSGSQWKVENHELGAMGPLSFGDQFRPWIKWVLCSYLLVIPIGLLANATEQGWLGVIAGLIAIHAAVVSSSACFGSGGAVLGGIFAYIAGTWIIVILGYAVSK